MIRNPNYIIIGAQRCGTTSLYEYISKHPSARIHLGRKSHKEVHFFDYAHNYQRGIGWYRAQFAVPDNIIIGEASPTYFDIAHTLAIPMSIKKAIPNIKLILIVRNPIDRAVSHFIHLCKVNKIEQLINMGINDFFDHSFANALKQTSILDYYLNLVLTFSVYFRKYQNYLSVFDRGQLLVLTNNELKNNPQVTMRKVFEYLELEPFESGLFSQFRYSTGSHCDVLNSRNIEKLQKFLYPDYKAFCKSAGINCELKHGV